MSYAHSHSAGQDRSPPSKHDAPIKIEISRDDAKALVAWVLRRRPFEAFRDKFNDPPVLRAVLQSLLQQLGLPENSRESDVWP